MSLMNLTDKPSMEASVKVNKLNQKPNVLVVDHHSADTIVMGHYLQQLGCPFVVAKNCDDALASTLSAHYDFIFVDLRVPSLRDDQLAKHIREHEKTANQSPTKIIALMASTHIGNQDRYREFGMDGYLSKPCHPQLLAEKLGL